MKSLESNCALENGRADKHRAIGKRLWRRAAQRGRYAGGYRHVDDDAALCHYDRMYFEILGQITHAETFAVSSSIREVARLKRLYGKGRWRK